MEKELLVGARAITEALRAERPIDRVWYSQSTGGRARELLRELQEGGAVCQCVPPLALRRVAGAQHQGIAARVAAVPFASLSEVLINTFEKGMSPLVLLVAGCTDVRNVGAMARSAEALGGHAMVVEQQKSAALGADCMRASAGALMHLPLCRFRGLNEACALVKEHGLKVIAASERGEKMCTEIDLSGPIAFVVGAEGEGIRPSILQASDASVRIPMSGKIEALNVSNAAAILLYEASKQRM